MVQIGKCITIHNAKKQCNICPYANETGTCFGFCWQKILLEHRIRRDKQYEEETEVCKEDG